MRGFSAVALYNPKCKENVGGAMRACAAYDASLIVLAGKRPPKIIGYRTDTINSWKKIPTIVTEDLWQPQPYLSVPIAVECLENARLLPSFIHPERAYYIFGPEDGSLPEAIIDKCVHKVRIPTKYCMNLASCVNVVLYDRLSKNGVYKH